MQTGYFSTAWNDIKNSPGWFGKLVVLSLVGLIPIFGWIVIYGYVFGWARDIAWNVHAPLPARVFGNEDGKLYSRGFFALVISLACTLVPWILEMVWAVVTGAGANWSNYGFGGMFALFGISSFVFFILMFAATLFALAFSEVGIMRMSIYGRLAPGLQFGKIWAMIRHDISGLVRIFGMACLLFLIASSVLFVVLFVMLFVAMLIGFVAGAPAISTNNPAVLFAAMPGLILLMIVLMVVVGVLSMMSSVFTLMMTARAMGYWTRQFDVPAWRGQDDPLPFEYAAAYGMPGGPGVQQPPQ